MFNTLILSLVFSFGFSKFEIFTKMNLAVGSSFWNMAETGWWRTSWSNPSREDLPWKNWWYPSQQKKNAALDLCDKTGKTGYSWCCDSLNRTSFCGAIPFCSISLFGFQPELDSCSKFMESIRRHKYVENGIYYRFFSMSVSRYQYIEIIDMSICQSFYTYFLESIHIDRSLSLSLCICFCIQNDTGRVQGQGTVARTIWRFPKS